jgi:hypothetical protein
VTGNSGTGLIDAQPDVKYPKGSATERAVSANQYSLFESLDWPEGPPQRRTGSKPRQTWMLLRKRVDDNLLAELSLPESMTVDGRVENWSVRIIVEIDLGPNLAMQDEPSEPPIDIPIRRRS